MPYEAGGLATGLPLPLLSGLQLPSLSELLAFDVLLSPHEPRHGTENTTVPVTAQEQARLC